MSVACVLVTLAMGAGLAHAQDPKPAAQALQGPFPVLDLQPWFADDHPFTTAQAKLARRDCKGALAEASPVLEACESCQGRNALRFLVAKAEVCAGQAKRGLARLTALDREGYPGMEVEVRAKLQEVQRQQGAQVSPDLEPSLLLQAHGYFQAQVGYAKQAAKSGHRFDALDRLRVVQSQAREGWMRRRAESTFQKINAARDKPEDSGEFSVETELDAMLPKLRRTKKRARKGVVQAFAQKHRLHGRDRKALDLLGTGMAWERERDREKSLRYLRRARNQAKTPMMRARVDFARGTSLRRLDRDDEAIKLYLQIAQELPEDPIAAESLYQASRLQLYQGQHVQARATLEDLMARYPKDARIPDALWQAAWAAWLHKDFDVSLPILERLAHKYGDHLDDSKLPFARKALYWRARTLLELGREAEAREGFRFVTDRFPLSYYAAMAHNWLEALGKGKAAAAPFQPSLSEPVRMETLRDPAACKVPAHPRVRRALELWKTGRRAEAREELMAQLSFRDAPRGVIEILATFHLHEGNLERSHWIASRYGDFSVAPYEGNARLWALAHPAPEKIASLIAPVAQEVGLSAWLPMAIIRHESSFQPSARSQVGALGLMQMMPATARVIERTWYGRTGPSRRALRKPSTNLRLGTTMLKMLGNYYEDNLPLMVAGYNAGTGVANRWWRDNKHLTTDALLEQMTYPGTRTYTRRVIASYYAYRVLYGDGTPPPIPLNPPKELGPWGPAPKDLPVGMLMPPTEQ